MYLIVSKEEHPGGLVVLVVGNAEVVCPGGQDGVIRLLRRQVRPSGLHRCLSCRTQRRKYSKAGITVSLETDITDKSLEIAPSPVMEDTTAGMLESGYCGPTQERHHRRKQSQRQIATGATEQNKTKRICSVFITHATDP